MEARAMITNLKAWQMGKQELLPLIEKPRQKGGGKRGKIKDFNRGSQRRLKSEMYELAALQTAMRIGPHDAMYFGAKTFQERIERFKKFIKSISDYLERKGYTGYQVKHLKTRQSGWYTGQVLPHAHLALCEELTAEEIKEITLFMVRAMKLPETWYEDAAMQNSVHVSGLNSLEEKNAYIGYIVDDLCPDALKKLNGEPIGRSWARIGNPKPKKPDLDKDLTLEQATLIRRTNRRYMDAKSRRLKGPKRGLSKAMKIALSDTNSSVTSYMPFHDIVRIYNFAVKEAADKEARQKQAVSNNILKVSFQGLIDNPNICPECLSMIDQTLAEKTSNIIDFHPTGLCLNMGAVRKAA
jgi:hypothetical protein